MLHTTTTEIGHGNKFMITPDALNAVTPGLDMIGPARQLENNNERSNLKRPFPSQSLIKSVISRLSAAVSGEFSGARV